MPVLGSSPISVDLVPRLDMKPTQIINHLEEMQKMTYSERLREQIQSRAELRNNI